MSEQRCGTCKWLRETGAYTWCVCAAPVPLWVKGARVLEERKANPLDTGCPVYEAKP